MSLTYRALFPILDEERPRSVLIAEACAVLDGMAKRDGARIVGAPVWTVAGDRLVCEAPAEALPPPEEKPARKPDLDLEILRMHDLRWSNQQIGNLLQVSPSTVGAVLSRHGRRSPYARFGRERESEGEE